MKTNNNMFIIFSGVIIIVGLLYYFFGDKRVAYSNEGELVVNERDPMLQQRNDIDTKVYLGTNKNFQDDYDQDSGYPSGFPPNGNPHLVGETRQGDMTANRTVENMDNKEVSCYPKEQLTPGELLPQDTSSTWAKVNPDGVGTLKDRNFLQAGHHIGIDTVGQTLRNANLQLRSEPPNPQVTISPWLQSSIEPDTNRRTLEIGSC